ncbi:MAG: porphobilinogen synthase [Candidatus Krumholzibacteriia bacterium]
MPFPAERLRRLRRTPGLRRMTRETRPSLDALIEPLFVCPGDNVRRDVVSMPGCAQMSIDVLVEECKRTYDLGIPSVLFFGIPAGKDAVGSEGYAPGGIVPRAIEAVKEAVPDATLPLLMEAAVAYTRAGADGVAPSDMMDGRVAAIRRGLDEAGFPHTPIMSYAAKFASAFYGPFRDAAESAPQFGDRRGYQMDPANGREALREIAIDIEEGADIVMVKPGFAYLDIIRMARETVEVPIATYNVSGEYSMIKAAARNGWIDEDRIILELMTAFHRAGADIILTYFARDVARLLS